MSALTEANQTQLIRNKNCYQLSSKQLTTVPPQAIPRVKTGQKKTTSHSTAQHTALSHQFPNQHLQQNGSAPQSGVTCWQPDTGLSWQLRLQSTEPAGHSPGRGRAGNSLRAKETPSFLQSFFLNSSYSPTCFLLIKASKETRESCVTYSLIKAFQVHPLLGLSKFLSVILALDFELIADRRSTKVAIARDFNDGHLRINKTVSDTQFKLSPCSKIYTKTCFSDFTSFARSDALNKTEITTSCLVCSPEADVGA